MATEPALTRMDGTCVLVTGATSGHGRAVAEVLAGLGADVTILGRNARKCETTRREIEASTGRSTGILLCNLSSRCDIERAAGEFLAQKRPLHLLVNNAGLVNQRRQLSEDGIEETFAVNYLALFQLTNLLLPRLRDSAPARIVNVASDAHRIATLELADLEGRNRSYSLMGAYGRSKQAILYFTRELARRIEGSGVTVNAVDPGPVASGIAKKPGIVPHIADAIIQLTFPSPLKAARTTLFLATSPDVEGKSGGYYRFMKMKEPKLDTNEGEFSRKLWELSEGMLSHR